MLPVVLLIISKNFCYLEENGSKVFDENEKQDINIIYVQVSVILY